MWFCTYLSIHVILYISVYTCDVVQICPYMWFCVYLYIHVILCISAYACDFVHICLYMWFCAYLSIDVILYELHLSLWKYFFVVSVLPVWLCRVTFEAVACINTCVCSVNAGFSSSAVLVSSSAVLVSSSAVLVSRTVILLYCLQYFLSRFFIFL